MNLAEHMRQNRIVPNTIRNYQGKINNMKLLLIKNNRQDALDNNNEIRLPVSSELLKEIFGWLSVDQDIPKQRRVHAENDIEEIEEENEIEEVDIFAESKITMSTATMQGYKSALLWYYTERGVTMNAADNKWINDCVKGYKKSIAKKKAEGVMSVTEGKSRLTFAGYCAICKEMMHLRPEGTKNRFAQSTFAWSFMTLSWNLMARCNSVNSIMLQHIDWKNDSLTVTFAKHKGDQTGEGLGNEKHVYANPLNPTICPILALAVLVFTKHRQINTSGVIHKQEIIDAMRTIPEVVKTLILATFRVENAIPVTMADMQLAIQKAVGDMMSHMTASMERLGQTITSPQATPATTPSTDVFEGYETFTWSNGQRWMCVPEGFVFPCHDAKTMWDLWHFGDATRRIRPYKKLMEKGKIDHIKKAQRPLISRTNHVVTYLIEKAQEKQLLEDRQDVSLLSRNDSDTIFNSCYPDLIKFVYGDSLSRSPTVSISTLANRLYKKRKAEREIISDNDSSDSN